MSAALRGSHAGWSPCWCRRWCGVLRLSFSVATSWTSMTFRCFPMSFSRRAGHRARTLRRGGHQTLSCPVRHDGGPILVRSREARQRFRGFRSHRPVWFSHFGGHQRLVLIERSNAHETSLSLRASAKPSSIGLFAATVASAQTAPSTTATVEPRWTPWLGCWQIVDESVQEAPTLEEAFVSLGRARANAGRWSASRLRGWRDDDDARER